MIKPLLKLTHQFGYLRLPKGNKDDGPNDEFDTTDDTQALVILMSAM